MLSGLAAIEAMTPRERVELVRDRLISSLDDLNPEFRARVEANARHLASEHGLKPPINE